MKFLRIETFITPMIIRFAYGLGIVIITVGGLLYIFLGEFPISALQGLGVITIGNLAWRMLCESWLLFFSIHEKLDDLQQNGTVNPSSNNLNL